jgi:hypothetical protein
VVDAVDSDIVGVGSVPGIAGVVRIDLSVSALFGLWSNGRRCGCQVHV